MSIWPTDDDHLRRAAAVLRDGGLIGMPTETVYGLAADARSGPAVAKVFAAKGRPSFNPLIVHVDGASGASAVGILSDTATALIEAFWPGPLTLVLPVAPDAGIADLSLAGLSTVAVRAPAHPAARRLLRAFGGPLVAPSANRSGRVSPTAAAHVAAELPGVPVLDGGPCAAGIESTIVGIDAAGPTLLRPGVIGATEIEAVLGCTLGSASGTVSAPGMLSSHYAPSSAVRIDAVAANGDEVLLGFGGTDGAALDLSPSGDLAEAAANLFAMLRQLDGRAPRIAVAPIPARGIGIAINDRLKRASAPRDAAPMNAD